MNLLTSTPVVRPNISSSSSDGVFAHGDATSGCTGKAGGGTFGNFIDLPGIKIADGTSLWGSQTVESLHALRVTANMAGQREEPASDDSPTSFLSPIWSFWRAWAW
jgi:hypothetical protein